MSDIINIPKISFVNNCRTLLTHKNKWIMQVIAASLRRSGRSVVYGGGDTTRRGQFKARKGGATGHASEANATFDWVEYNG